MKITAIQDLLCKIDSSMQPNVPLNEDEYERHLALRNAIFFVDGFVTLDDDLITQNVWNFSYFSIIISKEWLLKKFLMWCQ